MDSVLGPGEDDIVEGLRVMRDKLVALHHSLTAFLALPHHVQWPEVLAQFNTFISKYETLLSAMQDPMLKQLLVMPKSLPVEDPDFLPRVLLRTKLIPEVEDEERAVRLRHAERSDAAGMPLPLPTANRLDEGAIRQELLEWEERVEFHEAVAAFAEEFVDGFADYNFKSRLPADVRVAAPAAEANNAVQGLVGTALAATAAGAGGDAVAEVAATAQTPSPGGSAAVVAMTPQQLDEECRQLVRWMAFGI